MYVNGVILVVCFLVLNAIVETIGYYTFNNTWLYNVSNIIEILILNRLYFSNYKTAGFKKFSVIASILFLLFSLWNIIYGQRIHEFNSYSFLIGCLTLVTCACLYLYEFLLSEKYNSFFKNGFIWITAGIIIFYSCCFLILGSYNFLVKSDMQLLGQLFEIIRLVNLIMYCFIIIGIICLKDAAN